MNDYLEFKDGEIILHATYYNDEAEKYETVVRTIRGNDVYSVLNTNVEIPDDFTLRDYFFLVCNNPELQNLDKWFQSYIPYFEKNKYSIGTSKKSELDIIKISRVVELNETSIEKSNFFDILSNKEPDENGLISVDETDEVVTTYNDEKTYGSYIHVSGGKSDDKDEINYAIGFEPVDSLLHCKIINEEMVYVSTHDVKNSKYSNTKYKDNNGLCLYDFITSIIYELSFHGDEESKEERAEELKNRLDELDHIKNTNSDKE